MADKIAEFLKDDTISKTDLDSGVTVVSNASGETAVIKDITIENPNNKNIIFKNGAIEITKVNSSVTLSGSEIVGENSSITVTTDAAAIINRIRGYTSTSNFIETTFPTMFEAEAKTVDSSRVSINYQVSLSPVDPYFQATADDGTFYYAKKFGSTGPLKKLNGSRTTGTATSDVLSSDYRLYARDATRNYIYAITNSSQMVAVNLDTGQTYTKNKSGGYSPSTAYSHCSAIDGYFFYTSSYNNGKVTVVDMRDHTVSTYPANDINAGPDSSGVGYAYNLCVSKDKDGRYIVSNGFHSPYYVQCKRFVDPMVNTMYDQTYFNTGSFSPAVSYEESPGIQPWQTVPNTDGRYAVFYANGNTVYLFDSHDFPSPFYKITSSASNAFYNSFAIETDESAVSSDFGNIKIFARGIKTTA